MDEGDCAKNGENATAWGGPGGLTVEIGSPGDPEIRSPIAASPLSSLSVPTLVYLHPDEQFNEVLQYEISEGRTLVGSVDPSVETVRVDVPQHRRRRGPHRPHPHLPLIPPTPMSRS